MSFSGVSIPEDTSFPWEHFPTPGMSRRSQSWRGREMKVLNFLVVVRVVIITMWNERI